MGSGKGEKGKEEVFNSHKARGIMLGSVVAVHAAMAAAAGQRQDRGDRDGNKRTRVVRVSRLEAWGSVSKWRMQTGGWDGQTEKKQKRMQCPPMDD